MLLESLTSLLYAFFLISFTSNINCHTLTQHQLHHSHHSPNSSNSFFIFGDSYLDAGNNNYINTITLDKANFWPYGITFFHFPTGRFTDGRLISDFLAEYANLPLIQPYLQPGNHQFYDGVNFASAGSGALVDTFQGSVIDLHMQLRNFKKVEKWLKKKSGDEEATRRLRKAVYLFSIGINDYMSLYLANSTTFLTSHTKPAYVNLVINNITSVLNEIYKTGGRKFAFMNLPPIGCLPGIRMLHPQGDVECHKDVSSYVDLHNKAIFNVLKHFAKLLPGFKFALYDYHTSTLQRVQHPSKFGFKEGMTACCGTGRFRGVFSCGGKRPVKEYKLCKKIGDHIFWDSYHFTEKVYYQIAQELWTNKNYIHDHSHHASYTINHLFTLP